MRKLGLDVGTKSCGIAISDPLNITAQGLETVFFPYCEWKILISKIKQLLELYKIDTIVIGYPTFASGDKTATSKIIDQFVSVFKKDLKIPIVFINENQTTKKARDILKKGQINYKKQRQFKDKIAAQLILNDYLITLQ